MTAAPTAAVRVTTAEPTEAWINCLRDMVMAVPLLESSSVWMPMMNHDDGQMQSFVAPATIGYLIISRLGNGQQRFLICVPGLCRIVDGIWVVSSLTPLRRDTAA
jgi:hypothetical protein